ncbi:MAG: aminodeoxychorismate lyase [Colwellia sp.]
MKYCSINGKQVTTISVNDRGLSYGDGLFTTAKIVNGKVLKLNEHINRLLGGCMQLQFNAPNRERLKQQLTIAAKNFPLAVLKVVITAGCGGRGYSRQSVESNRKENTVIVMVHDYPKHYDKLAKTGISLGISQQKIGINPMLSGLKHLNRLEQVMLRAELDQRDEDDLVVVNVNEHVIEATSANLFWLKCGQLYTPELTFSGVNGLVRQAILQQYNVIIAQAYLPELAQADALFICNSVMGIMPVRQYNGSKLSINAVLELRNRLDD